MAEKEIRKGEKVLSDARKERDKGKNKKVAKRVEISGYHDREVYTYYCIPGSKIVNVEMAFTSKEEIVRGYNDRSKWRYMVGPPINMSDVTTGGQQKRYASRPPNTMHLMQGRRTPTWMKS